MSEDTKAEVSADNAWDHVQSGPPLNVPHAEIEGRPKLNHGDPDTISRYLEPSLDADQIVGTYGTLYKIPVAGNVWEEISEKDMYTALVPFAGALYKRPNSKGTKMVYSGLIRLDKSLIKNVSLMLSKRYQDEKFFNTAPVGVAFSNGFVGADGKLVPLTKEHRQRVVVEGNYIQDVDLDRDAPVFAKCLKEWFAKKDPTPEDIKDASDKILCITEFMGLGMMGGFGPSVANRANIQTAVINIGDGANGKSVYLELLKSLIPAEYLSGVSPQDMAHEYNRHMIAGKRVNVCPDLSEETITNTGHMKTMISCDSLIRARCIFKEPYNYQPMAGHVFNANRLPKFTDYSVGFLRRFIVISWLNSFKGKEDNKQLGKYLSTVERVAIASWCLQRGAEAFKRGSLTCPISSEAYRAEWLAYSDQVVEFFQDAMVKMDPEPVQESWTSTKEVYRHYQNWASQAGHKNVLGRNTFLSRAKNVIKTRYNCKVADQNGMRIPFLTKSEHDEYSVGGF